MHFDSKLMSSPHLIEFLWHLFHTRSCLPNGPFENSPAVSMSVLHLQRKNNVGQISRPLIWRDIVGNHIPSIWRNLLPQLSRISCNQRLFFGFSTRKLPRKTNYYWMELIFDPIYWENQNANAKGYNRKTRREEIDPSSGHAPLCFSASKSLQRRRKTRLKSDISAFVIGRGAKMTILF